MSILELWQQHPIAITVLAAIIIVMVSLAIYASCHHRCHGSVSPPTATLTDADSQASMSPDARPGNIGIKTVQEGHGQDTHSQTPTVCIIMVIGRNDATFWCPPTKQEEVGGLMPIKTGNGFSSFIHDYVIPTFCFQRLKGQQFAVLFLSKYDEHNIHNTQFGESSYMLILQL